MGTTRRRRRQLQLGQVETEQTQSIEARVLESMLAAAHDTVAAQLQQNIRATYAVDDTGTPIKHHQR